MCVGIPTKADYEEMDREMIRLYRKRVREGSADPLGDVAEEFGMREEDCAFVVTATDVLE
jgi:hypothetical protein